MGLRAAVMLPGAPDICARLGCCTCWPAKLPQSTCAPPQGRLVVLGGAFTCNGNVNPAAEANIFGDPDAANVVFGRWALQTAQPRLYSQADRLSAVVVQPPASCCCALPTLLWPLNWYGSASAARPPASHC